MAAEYTKFSLDDIEQFLKRAFRILRPKKGDARREIYFDLSLSKYVVIRVWTSVYKGEELVRGKERRPVRVQFLSAVNGYPLIGGKAPIVKRTQNWRKTLQDRIEDYVENQVLRLASLVLVNFTCIALCFIGIISVLKLAMGG